MELNALTAVSPIDGRYRAKTERLADYFSEFALIRYRVLVEVEYFLALSEIGLPQLPPVPPEAAERLRASAEGFSLADAERVKAVEREINHDVKAVEYFVKGALEEAGLGAYAEFVHFGLTSQDVNNTAIPLSLKAALETEVNPALARVQTALDDLSERWAEQPMLAFTHGQPASPTRMGKEMAVFAYRLREQASGYERLVHSAKFGGATGNFNAHHLAYPEVDWPAFADGFVSGLGLRRARLTTQIESYDHLAACFDHYRRLCTLLTDLCRDCWQYVAMGYFKQKVVEGEVGSSAMPHKVNPIDFENAEGNFGMAGAAFEHLSGKLPVSRLQRDLTDSTALRNVGVPFAHLQIALASLLKGLGKVELAPERLEADLDANWAVLAEAVQTVLRREGYPKPYEALKALTRGGTVTADSLAEFVDGLGLPESVRAELRALSPRDYVGMRTERG